jgi:hypothetical protein
MINCKMYGMMKYQNKFKPLCMCTDLQFSDWVKHFGSHNPTCENTLLKIFVWKADIVVQQHNLAISTETYLHTYSFPLSHGNSSANA